MERFPGTTEVMALGVPLFFLCYAFTEETLLCCSSASFSWDLSFDVGRQGSSRSCTGHTLCYLRPEECLGWVLNRKTCPELVRQDSSIAMTMQIKANRPYCINYNSTEPAWVLECSLRCMYTVRGEGEPGASSADMSQNGTNICTRPNLTTSNVGMRLPGLQAGPMIVCQRHRKHYYASLVSLESRSSSLQIQFCNKMQAWPGEQTLHQFVCCTYFLMYHLTLRIYLCSRLYPDRLKDCCERFCTPR